MVLNQKKHVFPSNNEYYNNSIDYISTCIYQSSWFVVEGTTFAWTLTLSTSLLIGNEWGRSDQTKQMQGKVDFNTLMMIEGNKTKIFGVSSSTTEALDTINMQELNGATTFDMPLMESMIHNRRCV